ncbi:MAG TPA: hypothetical protein VKG26_13755 [Bacteroidia bacterium]|nr:hypothetical protein [Bacteroidia bacterium]
METPLPKTKLEIELFCKNQVLENEVRVQKIYTQFLETALSDLRKKIELLYNAGKRGRLW